MKKRRLHRDLLAAFKSLKRATEELEREFGKGVELQDEGQWFQTGRNWI